MTSLEFLPNGQNIALGDDASSGYEESLQSFKSREGVPTEIEKNVTVSVTRDR